MHLQTLIDTPRGDAKEFRVPEPRLDGVARHSGTIVVQAAPDQQLQVTATGADNQPLREVDPADLPPLPNKSDDRTVAAYRFVQSGNHVTLTETRYTPVGVARAVCTVCEIQTMVPVSGECQHTATFQFLASGVQNLRLAIPEGANLWSTLIDGQPVEVRRGQSGYELPLKPGPSPDAERLLAVFYATPAPSGLKGAADETGTGEARESASTPLVGTSGLGVTSRFQQAPPEVSVVGSAGTPERMEVLHSTWTLHYPNDLTVAESQGDFRPDSTWGGIGLLTRLVRDLGAVSPTDIGWKLLEFFAIVVVVWLCVRGYSRWGRDRNRDRLCRGGSDCLGLAGDDVGVLSGEPVGHVLCVRPPPRAWRRATAGQLSHMPTSGISPLEVAQVWVVSKEMPRPGQTGTCPRTPVASRTTSAFSGTPNWTGVERTSMACQPRSRWCWVLKRGLRVKGNKAVRGSRCQLDLSRSRIPVIAPFEYIGRESADVQRPLVDVQFESLAGRRVFCGAIVAIVTFLLWLVRRRSWQVKGAIGALGLLLPVALAGVAPVRFEVWLDGIFLGTLCGVATWLIYESPRTVGSLSRRTPAATPGSASQRPLNAAGKAVLLVALLVAQSSSRAEGEIAPSKVSRTVVVPRPQQSGDAVIPYDPDKDPATADRVLLEQRTFLELWNRAHPERPLGTQPLPEAFVTEASYKASVVSEADSGKTTAATTSDRGQVSITGHLALYSRVDHPVSVALPFQEAGAQECETRWKSGAIDPASERTIRETPTPSIRRRPPFVWRSRAGCRAGSAGARGGPQRRVHAELTAGGERPTLGRSALWCDDGADQRS